MNVFKCQNCGHETELPDIYRVHEADDLMTAWEPEQPDLPSPLFGCLCVVAMLWVLAGITWWVIDP